MLTTLITGTSKGIGYEAALAFARAGHTVYAAMRNPAQSPALATQAAKENLPIHIVTMDVDSDASVTTAINAILVQGPIDILVNNAGIERMGSIEEAPLSDFRACMETNYFGAIRCIQALVPHMRERRAGSIVNVSSVAGRITSPPMAAYAASKWALEAMTEALAGELKTHNIRVALIEPGIIDTSMAQNIGAPGTPSIYPHRARWSAMFTASLQNATPPAFVAEKILAVASGDDWQLRHLVGPDAIPFLNWRATMTDEAWVHLNAGDDESYFASVAQYFGA